MKLIRNNIKILIETNWRGKMINLIKCDNCNTTMIYRLKLEDSNNIYKQMYYCDKCNSFKFVLLKNINYN